MDSWGAWIRSKGKIPRAKIAHLFGHFFWPIYNDLRRGHPKCWFSKGIPPKWPSIRVRIYNKLPRFFVMDITWVWPHRMPVTTRIITYLAGDSYKPSFATVTGRGDNPKYNFIDVNWSICEFWDHFLVYCEPVEKNNMIHRKHHLAFAALMGAADQVKVSKVERQFSRKEGWMR